MIKAGNFEADVSDPYPVHVALWYDGLQIARLNHKDLADLAYVVKRAQHEARRKLGEDKDEVML